MVAALGLSVCLPAQAFVQLHDNQKLETATDYRPGQQLPAPAALNKVAQLKARAEWNRFGTVHSMIRYGGYLGTGLTGTPVEAAREWVRQNRELFKLSDAGVDQLEVVNEGVTPFNEARAVLFRQRFGGLRVSHDGLITVGIVKGKVYYVSSSSAGDQAPPSAATLTPLQAWLKAAANVNRVVTPSLVRSNVDATAKSGWHLFEVLGFSQVQRARLVALPMPAGGVRQAYETVVVDVQPYGLMGYTHFIDAETGAVLYRENRVQNQNSTPAGQPFQGALASATACGAPHPINVAQSVPSARISLHAVVPANDLAIRFYQVIGDGARKLLANYDLLGGTETFNYTSDQGVPAGLYEIEICPVIGSTVPVLLPPYNYVGVFTPNDGTLPAGDAVVYGTAKWRWFPSSPLLDLSTQDTRLTACFGGSPAGCDEDVTNASARQPWDMLLGTVPTFTTIGNAAITSGSALNPVVGPSNMRLPVSPTRNYDFAFNNAWKESGCSPVSAAGSLVPAGNLNDIDASIVNLFVAHNRMHDWSYVLGFTERNYNMQLSNFGQTDVTVQNDPELGAAQAGAVTGGFPLYLGRDNASQLTLQDGIPGITTQYLFQPIAAAFYAPCTDGSFDMGIVGHEYTHAITNRMIGGPDQNIGGHQGGSMGESWSDLSALEHMMAYGYREGLNEPTGLATYVSGGDGTAFRNYQLEFNPLNYSNLGYDTGGLEVHSDGEIWNGTQWAVRQALIDQWNAQYPYDDKALQRRCADGAVSPEGCPGNRRWIQIMFDSYLLMPAAPSMLDARDAMLAADMGRFGGANQESLWRAFAARGMGEFAVSTDGDDGQPTPSFESPLATDEAEVTFEPIDAEGEKASVIADAKLFIGAFTQRTRPAVAVEGDGPAVFRIVPGTYDIMVQAPGYGIHSFQQTFEPGATTLTVKLPKNLASASNGATVITSASLAENQALAGNVIDDSEDTGAIVGDEGLVAGASITVQLAGGAHKVSRVVVSTAAGPDNPGRFTGVRAFEVRVCNGSCSDPAKDFETVAYTSAPDAFPARKARPLQPQLNARAFDFPAVEATHVQLRVLTNQCTGTPEYAGEQDSDPLNDTDCSATDSGKAVRATEFQVFSAAPEAEGDKSLLPSSFRGRFGGSLGWLTLLPLAAAALRRRKRH